MIIICNFEPGRSPCPGCGLSLPASEGLPEPRLNASAECWLVYGEVTGPAMTDPVLGELHQLTVDAYGAHHPRSDGPPIGLAFALIGLYLALDRGRTGLQVRDEHQRLARVRKRSGPPGARTTRASPSSPLRSCAIVRRSRPPVPSRPRPSVMTPARDTPGA